MTLPPSMISGEDDEFLDCNVGDEDDDENFKAHFILDDLMEN